MKHDSGCRSADSDDGSCDCFNAEAEIAELRERVAELEAALDVLRSEVRAGVRG